MKQKSEITLLLRRWRDGDANAADTLMPLVYDELHRRSSALFRSERPGHTIQPTALINEAYIRLADADVDYNDRTHFFAMASTMMRRLLIDHAKSQYAAKRGGGQIKLTFDESIGAPYVQQNDIIGLGDALEELHKTDPRRAHLIDLHYFGGLTVAEINR